MKQNNVNLTIGTRVKITTVPSPVKNIVIGTMGTIESKPTMTGNINQVDIKLDDGSVITWNVDYLEVVKEIEHKFPNSDDTSLKPEVINLPIDDIRQDGGTQPRAFMDGSTVQEYSLEMSNGVVFPPVIVFYDGTNYWLADGFHRVSAAVFCGWTTIAAIVKQGTCRDAVLFSCGVNATHGLRRSNEDKRRVVLRLLEDDEWSQWSNREISRQCGVSLDLVNRLRNSLTESFSKKSRIYKTKHGTVATMNISNIGKTPQPTETSSSTMAQSLNPENTDSPSTSVEKELPQQGEPLGLPHNQRTDQVLPDVKPNQTTPNDVDDRSSAQVNIAALDSETRKAIIALKEQLLSLEDHQLQNLGKVIGVKCEAQAKTLASSLAIAEPEIARAVINAIAAAYPFLGSDRGNS